MSTAVALAEPGTYEVAVRDEVYASPAGQDLLARLFVPVDAPAGRPIVVDVHGGAWSYFDRKVDEVQCRGLASAGAVVASVDFRQAPDAHWPDPVADVAAAVRWAKAEADRLQADPGAAVLMGGSSGGHLALWVALRGEHPECAGAADPDPDGVGPDAGVRGVLGLWPVAAPDERYRYLEARAAAGDTESRDPMFNVPFLTQAQRDFFGDEDTMAAASIPRLLATGDHRPPPPLLLVHPELDENITRAMTDALADAWRTAGGRCDVLAYPDVPHSFVNFGGPAADACVVDLVAATRSFLSAPDPGATP